MNSDWLEWIAALSSPPEILEKNSMVNGLDSSRWEFRLTSCQADSQNEWWSGIIVTREFLHAGAGHIALKSDLPETNYVDF